MWLNRNSFRRTAAEPIRFVEIGEGEQTIIFLHGLFGSPDHWRTIMSQMGDGYRLIAPQFPIDRNPTRRKQGARKIPDLTNYVADVFHQLDLQRAVICGNSLGGVVAIDFSLTYPEQVDALVLTGSAGLQEYNLMRSERPRATVEWIRPRAEEIFYDQKHVTDELVNDLYEDAQDRDYTRFLLRMAKATRDHYVKNDLHKLNMPTLLVWGREDRITPPAVAEEFHREIRHSELVYVEECGHSPNLEHPQTFVKILREYLDGSLSPTRP